MSTVRNAHPFHFQLMDPPVTDEPPPPVSSFSCDRHRSEDNFTSGFCPSCLSERLTIIDQSSNNALRRTKSLSYDQRSKSNGVMRNDNINSYEVRVSKEEEEMSDLEGEILEMEAKIDAIVENLKSMKDGIDVASKKKKPSSLFWSKKWKKWRGNEKKSISSHNNNNNNNKVVKLKTPEDYGFGAARFSLDAGRVSLKEEERWDGIGERSLEPGGSTQTREYYLKSSSRRRKAGLERSNSMAVGGSGNSNNSSSSIGGVKEISGAGAGDNKPRWWNWKIWKNAGELTSDSSWNKKAQGNGC